MPAGFWDTDQIRDALASWHIGRVIHAYRTHPHHQRPLTQEQVGRWLGLTQAQLSRIENGRAPEELTKLIHYSRTLHIPAHLLWFDLPGETRVREPTLDDSTDQNPAYSPEGTDGSWDGGLGSAGRAGSGEPGAQARAAKTANAPAGLRFRAATHVDGLLDPRPRRDDTDLRLDGDGLVAIVCELDRCKADDGRVGPAQVLPPVLAILKVVTRHARDARSGLRRGLLTVGADAAEFAGWLYRDLHDQVSAGYWYDRAMEWAQAAQDLPMQGYILLRKSQMAYSERDAGQVLALAQAAYAGPWQLPRRVRAEVLQQEARGLAMTGEPIDLVERKLEEARALLAVADEGPTSPLGAGYDEGTWRLRSASCYVEAGKPRLAAAFFADVLAGGTLAQRDEAYYRARRAVACALAGEPDDASQEALLALTLAGSTSSERTRCEVARVVRILTPWQSHPGPQALRSALHAKG
ncbi:helix-turn-helix transcriptional regulator [Pseudofrankia sp. DC12]|uniref:helix-turn-helix domain-containing protein n=1 Tax=Pseudofrankia sp. DC12 TaxID=683315 RepID=UPI001E51FC68|nr:helix-turn-helix transcriptional regulator [Pseudofrankia sp. DC12]